MKNIHKKDCIIKICKKSKWNIHHRKDRDHRDHRYERVEEPKKQSNRTFIDKKLARRVIIDCRKTSTHEFRTKLGFNPNPGRKGRGGGFYLPPSWFSFNNSKTVKAVTLEICSIQWNSVRDIRAKFGIHNLPQSSGIGQNSDGGISNFRTSGQSFTKENCHNLRTSDDIDMKLGPVTKFDKRNKTTSEKPMMTSCQKIVTSFLFFWFLAKLEQSRYQIPDTESAKVMFLVIATFFLTKLKIELKHP